MGNIHKFNRFKYYSEKAAISERQGDLQDAKEQWAIAELNASGQKIKNGANGVVHFCDRVIRKPF